MHDWCLTQLSGYADHGIVNSVLVISARNSTKNRAFIEEIRMKNIIVILANCASAKSLTIKDGGILKTGNWGGMCHVLLIK